MNFFKRQKYALETRAKNGDDVVFAKETPQSKYEYSTCATQEEYANYLLDNRYCNEMLWTHTKSYYDLDAKTTLSDLLLTEDEFIMKFNKFLQESYLKYLGITVLEKDIYWSSSCRPEKLSFHIVINHPSHFWHVDDRHKHLKTFVKQLVSDSLQIQGLYVFVQNNTEFIKQSLIDLAVYSQRRLLRSVGQCKRGVDVELAPRKKLSLLVILNHLVTLPNVAGMTRIAFKKDKITDLLTKKEKPVSTKLLDRLAEECGAIVSDIKGSLVTLRNKEKTRKCILNNCVHQNNNCYFLKRNNEILFGCHGCPDTPCKVVHTYETEKDFQFYESYKKILDIHEVQPESFCPGLIENYLLQTVRFIDQPNDPHFITCSRIPVFNGKLFAKQTNSSKNLFFRHSDIHLEQNEEVIKFSNILANLTRKRRIKTYNSTCWVPFAKGSNYLPELSQDSLNLFSGYNLEEYRATSVIDFTKTKIYELISRNLTNGDEESLEYLLSFISHRLQKSWVTIPICQIWCNSCPGTGKSTFSEFLKKLFSSGTDQTFVSYSNMESFCSAFNFEKRHALFVSLEEAPQGRRNKEFDNYLKDFISSPEMLLEAKGVDRRVVPSYSSVLVYSNQMKVISVDQRDRRMVFYVCSNETKNINKKKFFDELYRELDSLDILKSAFNFFLSRDISKWDYRNFPVTQLRKKVQQCSIQLDVRWLRYFFTMEYWGGENFVFSKMELYEFWKVYIDTHGVSSRRDFDFVVSSFELAMDVEPADRHDSVYKITRVYAEEKLQAFFGYKVILK